MLSFPTLRSLSCGIRAMAIFTAVGVASAADGPKITLGAAGWFNYGSIVSSSDTAFGIDVAGKPMISSGAQIVLKGEVSDHLEIQAGVGAAGSHFLAAKVTTQGGYSPYDIGPYVAQANFTYNFWKESASGLFLRGGLFAYDYAEETQNLGLYLLRGPVYPGFVLSGFETKHVLPVANMLGLQAHHQAGSFQHDVLMQVETEFKPYYDVSVAYLASFRAGSAFRLTGGVNFNHLISVDPSLTTDTTRMRWVDTTGAVDDTVQLSARAIKLMVNAAVDFKALFGGEEVLGVEDLKLYGEVALFGLENSRVYKDLYGPYSQRMPMMVGFNLPVFKLLDRLALEVEYYGAPFKDDLKLFENTASTKRLTVPMDPDSNITRDNLKWSLYGSRKIHDHIKISVQVASDHFRPGVFTGYGDNNPPQSEAVLFRPSEWYWMSKVAYFF